MKRRLLIFKSLFSKEDWWAVWLGLILVFLTSLGFVGKPVLPNRWGQDSFLSIMDSIDFTNISGLIYAVIVPLILFSLALFFTEKSNILKYSLAFMTIILLAFLAYLLGNYYYFRLYGFNEIIWALALGLLISNVFKVPNFLKVAIRSELYIKTGLVLLGASILFNRFLSLGLRGLGVAWLVTPVVLIIMFIFSQKVLKMQNQRELAITVSAATSVCGVSAAVATGTAVKANKDDITAAISITLIFTVIMMVTMPFIARFIGLSEQVGGAWLGGTIDSTGAVVAAGSMLGSEAMEVASVIKMLQNMMIGFIAFFISIFWIIKYENKSISESNVKISEVWTRMPKFIIGFVGLSLLFSFILSDSTVSITLPNLNSFRSLFFTLAFISIGLESNIKDFFKQFKGSKPIKLYLIGQTLNIVLTLFAALIFFR